jgi:dCTP deaminase
VLLSDRDIRAEIAAGRVQVEPFTEAMIQPSSVDVRLDRFFRVFENHKYSVIDPSVEQPDLTRAVETEGDEPFILHPGEFVLASTYEVITLPDDIAGRLEGKSSLGRLGLLTHSTAGFIDPGFSGHITLELSNVANLPVKLFPGMKIGQLCLIRLSSPAEHPYGSAKYGSRVNTDDQEYFVKVQWIKTFSRAEAYDELGFFGNQNSVCKPTASRWRSTVEHLKDKFGVN